MGRVGNRKMITYVQKVPYSEVTNRGYFQAIEALHTVVTIHEGIATSSSCVETNGSMGTQRDMQVELMQVELMKPRSGACGQCCGVSHHVPA